MGQGAESALHLPYFPFPARSIFHISILAHLVITYCKKKYIYHNINKLMNNLFAEV